LAPRYSPVAGFHRALPSASLDKVKLYLIVDYMIAYVNSLFKQKIQKHWGRFFLLLLKAKRTVPNAFEKSNTSDKTRVSSSLLNFSIISLASELISLKINNKKKPFRTFVFT